MKFIGFSLHINNEKESIPFYQNILGLELVDQFVNDNETIFTFKNRSQTHQIELVKKPIKDNGELYIQYPTDNYWKFSLFVDDIQRVHKQLNENNQETGKAYQFGDIGYLMHTIDKENHQIEFIQKTFKDNSITTTQNESFFLKEQPVLGLLTIRTKDPIKIIRFFENILGLKLLVRMHVNVTKGFTLYFLGDKNLVAPNPDIDAVENRKWMYKENHLFIEIQHYWGNENNEEFKLNTNDNGLKSINFTGNIDYLTKKLFDNNIEFIREFDRIIFETIDHHKIIVRQTDI